MRIVVYSQVRLFAESLVDCLKACEDVESVELSRRIERLPRRVVESSAQLVLFDVGGERAMEEARAASECCPETPFLALAIPETAESVIACVDAGFSGYIPSQATFDEMCEAMRLTLRGECSCSPKIAGELFREVRRRRGNGHDNGNGAREPLTRRESEVLGLVAHGLSNKEIADDLSLSVATIKNHLHSVFSKLQVSCRAEALSRLRNEPWLVRSS